MIAASIPMPPRKVMIWILVAAGLALVIGANAHLVYVAVTSQPDCVDHVRVGDAKRGDAEKGDAEKGSFRAAKSACSPGARS